MKRAREPYVFVQLTQPVISSSTFWAFPILPAYPFLSERMQVSGSLFPHSTFAIPKKGKGFEQNKIRFCRYFDLTSDEKFQNVFFLVTHTLIARFAISIILDNNIFMMISLSSVHVFHCICCLIIHWINAKKLEIGDPERPFYPLL